MIKGQNDDNCKSFPLALILAIKYRSSTYFHFDETANSTYGADFQALTDAKMRKARKDWHFAMPLLLNSFGQDFPA